MPTGMTKPVYETRTGIARFLAAPLPGRHLAGALLTGLAVRLFFVLAYPTETTDFRLYDQLARNWLYRGVYGLWLDDKLVPVDVRAPGYPAFLAAIYALAGPHRAAVMLAQAVVDLATCLTIAFLAALLMAMYAEAGSGYNRPAGPTAPATRRAAIAAVWLAALCPFTANYTAAPLTEPLTIFLTAVALLILVSALLTVSRPQAATAWSLVDNPAEGRPGKDRTWFFAGLVAGVATLVRPETPLLLGVVGLVLFARWWRPRNWGKLIRVGLLLAAGLILPLAPWAVRNWRTLGELQFLAPRYAQLPDEEAPAGFYAWVRTWQARYTEADMIVWKLETDPLSLADVPAAAFDTQDERERVAALFAKHNEELKLTPRIDQGFQQLADERARRHRFRTWLWLPLRRAVTMWFTPRIELLPYSGQVFPLAKEWDEDREDLVWTLALWLVNLAYLALAVAGSWKFRHSFAVVFLVSFAFLRTVFFTQMDAPEPRYLLVCFPAVIALAALAFVPKHHSPLAPDATEPRSRSAG